MSLELALYNCFEWSAELYMLRESIDNAPRTTGIPVTCWVGGVRLDINWKARWKQVVVNTMVNNMEIQTFRVNHNTTPGLLIATGKPGRGNDELVNCLPVTKQVQWFYGEDDKTIFHNYPLVDGNNQNLPGAHLSDIAFMRMMLRIFPWLE